MLPRICGRTLVESDLKIFKQNFDAVALRNIYDRSQEVAARTRYTGISFVIWLLDTRKKTLSFLDIGPKRLEFHQETKR